MATAEQPDDDSDEVRGPLYDLTAFQRDVLTSMAKLDGSKGLAIKSFLEEFYNKDIYHGRLYPNLGTLKQMGLIKVSKVDKRTNCYEITPRGKRELEADSNWRQSCLDDE